MSRLMVFIVFAAVLGLSSALYVKVEPREEKCFYYDFVANSQVQVSLSVPRGGLLDIRYKVSTFFMFFLYTLCLYIIVFFYVFRFLILLMVC